MKLELKISSNNKISFVIRGIPKWMKTIKYEDRNIKLDIKLSSNAIEFFKTKKNTWSSDGIFLKKTSNSTFSFSLSVKTNVLLEHNFNDGLLTLEKSIEQQYSYILIYKKGLSTELKRLIEKAQWKQENKAELKQKKVERKLRKANEQKIRTQKLVEKFDKMEEIHGNSSKSPKLELDKKGIHLAHPNSYNRCYNCANFSGSNCSAHNVEVSENHKCSRFHSYKTLYGGGFSPR